MTQQQVAGLSLLGALLLWAAQEKPAAPPVTPPVPVVPDAKPKPLPKVPRPWGEGEAPVGAKVGGPVSPSGKEIQCDLPNEEHCKNISSRGQGCCVQTSINHSARWQNVPALIDFHKWVQEKGLPGGAYPGAVDDRLPKCCKDRGYPTVPYLQIQGKGPKVVEALKLALKTGRMPAVTYSKSPTGRYGGQVIAHMVSMPNGDEEWVAILDNNYTGADKYEWCTWDEFERICNRGGSIWAVVLLTPPPPPPPRN